jgi:hypothetical protein
MFKRDDKDFKNYYKRQFEKQHNGITNRNRHLNGVSVGSCFEVCELLHHRKQFVV